jgi:tellurite resistance protein
MASLDYSHIAPLISTQRLQGSRMEVVFQCPVTGQQIPSSATVRQGMASRAVSSFKRNAIWSLRSSLYGAVRSVLGGGVVGRTASGVLSQATYGSNMSTQSYSAGDREAAVLEAFGWVQDQFVWDSARGGFVHSSAPSSQPAAHEPTGFEQAVAAVKLTDRWDRAVLARMLAEIAGADGGIAPEERELFAAFGADEFGSIEALLQRPPLHAGELAETSPAVRETMLMLAFAVAYSDEHLDAEELVRLQDYARGMQLSQAQLAQASALAQEHVMTQLLEAAYATGRASEQRRAELYQSGSFIGMDQSAIQRLEAQVCKRHGIY